MFPSSSGTIRHPNKFRVQWHTALGETPFSYDVPKTLRSSVATMIAMEEGADAAKEQMGARLGHGCRGELHRETRHRAGRD